jgi:DNA-binding GntR family transcriptional regulator
MRRAARTLTPEHLERLAALIEEMEIAEREGRADDYGHLNREFHFAIYEAQPYQRLLGMIRDLWNSTDWCGRIFARDTQSLQASTREHRGIYEALCRGDGDTAAAHLEQQKRRSCAWLLEHVEADRVPEPEPNTDPSGRNA